jgi:galactose-1-phosphate uridylyltransferase
MTRDNIVTWRTYADEEWSRTAADPLTVDEEPWHTIAPATRNRDGLLLALAVLVIVALAGYAIGRASA